MTTPIETLIDLAALLDDGRWEAAVNEADSLDLCTADDVREAARRTRRPGVARVARVLDPLTFALTHSELERLFLPLVYRAGLRRPTTQAQLGSHRVDFYWPELDLVVECDSLRYHRTASRQTKDLLRDQAHALADRERLRFSHWQVRHDSDYVAATLAAVARRLAA